MKSDREVIEVIVREIHQDGFSAGIHGQCGFNIGHLNKYVGRIIDEQKKYRKSSVTQEEMNDCYQGSGPWPMVEYFCQSCKETVRIRYGFNTCPNCKKEGYLTPNE